MKAVFFVLNDAAKLTSLLTALNEAGIYGSTIFTTSGLNNELAKLDDFNQMFGLLRRVIHGSSTEHKVLLFVMDESRIPLLVETIESVVGSLEGEGTGILFSIPVDFTKGLKY